MLIFEIAVFGFFILFTILGFKYGEDIPLYGILAFLFFVGIIVGVSPTSGGQNPNQNTPIVSLERGSEVNWSFVLWFWTIETRNVYYAYQDLGLNQYYLATLPNVVITETDDREPAYSKRTVCKRDFAFTYCRVVENTIYVPVGTIQKRFSL